MTSAGITLPFLSQVIRSRSVPVSAIHPPSENEDDIFGYAEIRSGCVDFCKLPMLPQLNVFFFFFTLLFLNNTEKQSGQGRAEHTGYMCHPNH